MCRIETGGRSCGIHAACQDRNCSVAVIRKLVHEEGVETLEKKDIYGRVPLFYAIRSNCGFPVVQLLFDAAPNAILRPDFCGDLPLYLLFRSQTDYRFLEYVLNRNPTLALFREKRFSGTQSLLQGLCTQWMDVRNKNSLVSSSICHAKSCNVRDGVIIRSRVNSDRTLLDRWTKLVLTIRATHHVSCVMTERDNAGNDFVGSNAIKPRSNLPSCEIPALHIALQLDCLPPGIVSQFIEMYPEQAAIPMQNTIVKGDHGKIPFLPTNETISVSGTPRNSRVGNDITESMRTEECIESTNSRTFDPDTTSMLPLHFFLSKYTSKTKRRIAPSTTGPSAPTEEIGTLLRSLVRAFPKAASIGYALSPPLDSCLRRLPVHMAIAGRLSWEMGLKELAYANPSALAVEDRLGTNLVPFLQQAAMVCREDIATTNAGDSGKTLALNTAYCLLREDPAVLSRMIAS